MTRLLSDITRIHHELLGNNMDLADFSVATKMSWAANRQTTRIEDQAYCLLGLFDVNMPLLYGEEEKAYQRLQAEIIRSTPDFSIFAWTKPIATRKSDFERYRLFCGVLATSPDDFGELPYTAQERRLFNASEFALSNVGLRTKASVTLHQTSWGGYSYILPLQHLTSGYSAAASTLGVRLRKCGENTFTREDPWKLFHGPGGEPSLPEERYFLTSIPAVAECLPGFADELFIEKARRFALQIHRPPEVVVEDVWPASRYDEEDQLFFTDQSTRDCCMTRLWLELRVKSGNYDIPVRFGCVFYAVGWSSDHEEDIQCTLVDYRKESRVLDRLRDYIVSWDLDRIRLIDTMNHERIPRQAAIVADVPGTDWSVFVSYTLKRTPLRMSSPRQNSWTIKFFTQVYNSADVPHIDYEVWEHVDHQL